MSPPKGSREKMIASIEKEMNRGENAANKRFGKLSLDELQGQREQLELLIEKFRQMEVVIRAFRFDKENIRVDGITKFDRAYNELQTYIDNVEKGIKIHKHGEVY